MADDEGVRRRDVLKGLGVTGAVAGIVATTASPGVDEAQAQPAAQPHAHTMARNDQAADAFRFFTPPEAAVVVALARSSSLRCDCRRCSNIKPFSGAASSWLFATAVDFASVSIQ